MLLNIYVVNMTSLQLKYQRIRYRRCVDFSETKLSQTENAILSMNIQVLVNQNLFSFRVSFINYLNLYGLISFKLFIHREVLRFFD